MDKTVLTIRNLSATWVSKMILGNKYNTSVSIGFTDDEYELLTCIEHDLKGTGSISYGYDHDNGDETKGLSLVQPKKCECCGVKLHFFAEVCLCGSKNFKYISDSRWGIDSNAHFNHNIPFYHLWVFYPEKYSHDCKKFFLKQFIIDSNNIKFKEILNVQIEKGKNINKNFLPFSMDFYASNPKEQTSITILIDDLYGVLLERNEPQQILYNREILKKMSKVLNKNFKINKDIYHYDEIYEFIDIKNKKTTHGKSRGNTTRRDK